MTVRPLKNLGTFHARVTRDAGALDRDGQVFVLRNELAGLDTRGDWAVENMFNDGFWMLATAADLSALNGSEGLR